MFTTMAMTRQLKASLNNKLRRALVGVKLPHVRQYNDWVATVREVAEEVERFSDYCPKGSTQTVTKIGPPKGGIGIFMPENGGDGVDQDGDTKMSGTDAILAAIKDLKLHDVHLATTSSGKPIKKNI